MTAVRQPQDLVIVDYGMGNLGSIKNMLKKVGAPSTITSDLEILAAASKVILPGVGAFDAAMTALDSLGLVGALDEHAERGTPVLGICLGMQLMTKRSEEGDRAGLGWVDAEMRRFDPRASEPPLKVPHMGWNTVRVLRDSPLFADMPAEPRFYFVHSYYADCNPDDALADATYGRTFTAAFERGNVLGVQFHPEKSHKFGMQLLRNFVERY